MWHANLGFKCKTSILVVSKWFSVPHTERASEFIHTGVVLECSNFRRYLKRQKKTSSESYYYY